MNKTQIENHLAEAEQAYHDLLTGQAVVSFTRNGRESRFTPANKDDLLRYITDLRAQLSRLNGSRPSVIKPARFYL
ncbi:gpW family protein [Pseudoalteromonas luteoviolacea]|uniref:gpW family protein n=1 Tax=Pseudoalteromonas luteoviolacea TaxID=43657 RepID=UPI001B35FDB2|nr:gpW family protein [Pseudoalteromonas luteoviolacea]MBQ4836049.1 gpW family protein [Pseudoalteromonas luteoviolacea]